MLIGANGIRVNAVDEGRGSAVVFLHTSWLDWSQWLPQIAHFAPRFRCVALDLRNHGRSDTTYGPLTLELLARDVADVAAAMDLPTLHLVGSGLGATVAAQVALDHPGLLASLTLASTFLTPSDMDWAAPLRDPEAGESSQRRVIDALFAPSTPDEVRRRLSQLGSGRDPLLAHAFPGHLRGSLASQVGRLGEISARTLVLFGAEDRLVSPRRVAEQAAASIPDARIAAVARAAHFPNAENPEEFNSLVEAHLGE